jgi:DEAD/DEAH box helicase domain-containing protein
MISPDLVTQLLLDAGLSVRERQTIAGREAVTAPIPVTLDARVADLLRDRFPKGLWKHQVIALERAIAGQSLCIATQTASGKSHIFMAAAAHRLLTEPTACVLTLYPARALIQDQLAKWHDVLDPLGVTFGYIDGGVATERRPDILRRHRLVLMTPDVAHAWLLSHAGETWARTFFQRLSLLILDEAHVYEGVFGTNFAYFMRRLLALSTLRQVLAASATLGEPEAFLRQLTGLSVMVLGPSDDGAPAFEKTIVVAGAPLDARQRPSTSGDGFTKVVDVVRRLADASPTPFIAFADSRRMVEHVVAALHRQPAESTQDGDDEPDPVSLGGRSVLPYRSGYEEADRIEIQKSLADGSLRGVVSTSALELGIDIGHLDVVVMLQPPPTRKAFWQRLGRAGRSRPGLCLVLDLGGRFSLGQILGGPTEPNRLYLENRYLQYTNALCAAAEVASIEGGSDSLDRYVEVPAGFRRLLANELTPSEAVPPELASLKQRAQASGPHLEFPLRDAIDEVYTVADGSGRHLGQVTYTQALREAYPGAVYYYLARPYRVVHIHFGGKRIRLRREKHYTTLPDLLQLAFPLWPEGLLALWTDTGSGFVAETELQVSEKLTGFIEQRGSVREQHHYEPGSPFYRRPLLRFFETTGVAWWFPGPRLSEEQAKLVLLSFCDLCGVQERDVALGMFHAKRPPLGTGEVSGWCIYDSTYGSLRLTQQLGERFREVAREALQRSPEGQPADALQALVDAVEQLAPAKAVPGVSASIEEESEDWVTVVARGEPAILFKAEASEEVRIKGFRYTPKGVVYDLEPGVELDTHQVRADSIKPLHGVTRLVRWNVMTGEERALDE